MDFGYHPGNIVVSGVSELYSGGAQASASVNETLTSF